MSDSLALTLPSRGPPATLEARALFRVKTAALHGQAAPQAGDPSMILVTKADGGVVVYPPSTKLAILAAERAKRQARAAEPPSAA